MKRKLCPPGIPYAPEPPAPVEEIEEVTEEEVDLFAAENAMLLSATYSLLGDRMEGLRPLSRFAGRWFSGS